MNKVDEVLKLTESGEPITPETAEKLKKIGKKYGFQSKYLGEKGRRAKMSEISFFRRGFGLVFNYYDGEWVFGGSLSQSQSVSNPETIEGLIALGELAREVLKTA